MAGVRPLGKAAIESHVLGHVESLSRDGALYTVPCPPGDELVQVQVYAHPAGHWHYITYGLTSLYEGTSPADPNGPDGFGYELTWRLPREGDQPPSTAPIDLLRALARVLGEGRHRLGPNHTLPLAGPIAVGSKHSAFAVAADPELGAITTPLGRVELLLLVGITQDEERACASGSTAALLDRLRADDALLVTRHDREPVTISSREEGSRLEGQHVLSLDWAWSDGRGCYRVDIQPPEARAALVDVVYERVRTHGVYWIGTASRMLRIERSATDESETLEHTRATPPTLVISLSSRGVESLRTLRALPPGAPLRILDCELHFTEPVDARIEVVRAAFAPAVPELARGAIRIDRVAGTPGQDLLVAVSSVDRDEYAPGAMIGLGGAGIRAALERLGGMITVVETHDDPLQLVARALAPVSAAGLEIDEREVMLIEPRIRVSAQDPMSDAELIVLATRRCAVAGELVRRTVRVRGAWQVQRVG